MKSNPFKSILSPLLLCKKCKKVIADYDTGLCRKCEIDKLEKQQLRDRYK